MCSAFKFWIAAPLNVGEMVAGQTTHNKDLCKDCWHLLVELEQRRDVGCMYYVCPQTEKVADISKYVHTLSREIGFLCVSEYQLFYTIEQKNNFYNMKRWGNMLMEVNSFH